jgi:hypothetical protein
MIKKFITAASITSMFLLASCATESERNTKNPFDPLTLKENLIEGKTTQTEMLQTFGAPDMVTESSSKEDVWTYNQVKHESKGNSIGGGLIGFIPIAGAPLADIWGSTRNDESSSKSVTLLVIFNKKKIVKSYSLNKVKI